LPEKPTILIAGMLDSIHLARWVSQLGSLDAKVVITGTSPYRKVRSELEEFVSRNPEKFSIIELFPRTSILGHRVFPAISFVLDRFLGDFIRGTLLRRLILRVSPTVVHVNELIVAGMPAEFALRGMTSRRFHLWVTNYGSELIWRAKGGKIQSRMRRLLDSAQTFSAECQRDVKLAQEMGFSGVIVPVFPVSGGIENRSLAPLNKNIVALKGYDNDLGMGARALSEVGSFALENPHLEIEVVAYSCNRPTLRVASELSAQGVRVRALRKGALSHREMLELFGKAVAYVGASRSDGISTSVLEAMSGGAIPIQTASSCAAEWFMDGETGFSVSPDDLSQISKALATIFSPRFDLDGARKKNQEVLASNADPIRLCKIALQSYERII
jgi:glycosyltransferase involved in cell wall biosynthesis